MILRKALRLRYPHFTTTASSTSLRNLISSFSSSADAASTPRPSTKPYSEVFNSVYRESEKFAGPATVTWLERLNISVSLVGTVEYLPKQCNSKDDSDRVGCRTVLLVKPSSGCHFSVTLSMWDLVAEKALAHLKPNDYIYVSGQLGSFTKFLEGEERLFYKVKVEELNYVEVPHESYQVVTDVSGDEKIRNRLRLWELLSNPDEWYDKRKTKKSPEHPDFKHKTTGEALWLIKEDPPWLLEQLELLDSRLTGEPSDDVTVKELNYVQAPDETYQAGAKPESETYQAVAKPETYQAGAKPESETYLAVAKTESDSVTDVFGEDKIRNWLCLWEFLFAKPNDWIDNRKTKKSPRSPDFVHKSRREALWRNEDDPPWLLEQLELLDSRLTGKAIDDVTVKELSYVQVPDETYQAGAKPKSVTYQAVAKPKSVTYQAGAKPKSVTYQAVAKPESETDVFEEEKRNRYRMWLLLFANPHEWYDDRKRKKSPRHPDFKHKSTGEALWLSKDDPPWLREHLEVLDSN